MHFIKHKQNEPWTSCLYLPWRRNQRVLQHLLSRHSNKQVEHSWNPYSRLLLLSNMHEFSGLRTEQRETLQPWWLMEGHLLHLLEYKLHPWRLSALKLDWVALCSTDSLYSLLQAVNCLSCSLLGITPSWFRQIQSPVCDKKNAQGYNLHTKKKKISVKYSSNEGKVWQKQADVHRWPQLRFKAAVNVEV